MPYVTPARLARPARRFSLIPAVLHHLALRRSRAALLRLDDHLLRDIGLTRDEAAREALQGSWGAPPHRRG